MLKLFFTILWLLALTAFPSAFEIQEVKSRSGITAWLVREPSIPLIAVDFAFATGSATDKPGKEGTANLVTALMDEGAGDLDGPAFQARRDDLGAKLYFSASTDRLEGGLQTTSRHRSAAFDLLRLALTRPQFRQEAIERMRKSQLVNAEALDNNPRVIASRSLIGTLLGAHPYTRRIQGSAASLQAISRDDIVASWRSIFSRRGLKIAVVGDITADELSDELDRAFGELPNTLPSISAVLASIASGPSRLVIERQIPQTIVMFGLSGVTVDDPDYMAAVVMSQIMGADSNSRLNSEVREKRGLTYGIGFDLVPLEHAGLYLGSFSTANESAGSAMDIVTKVVAEMASSGPTQEELDAAKAYMTGSFALSLDSSSKIAGFLLSQQLMGRDRGYIDRRNSLIEAVTLEQVKAQAKRLLKPENFHIVAVGMPVGFK